MLLPFALAAATSVLAVLAGPININGSRSDPWADAWASFDIFNTTYACHGSSSASINATYTEGCRNFGSQQVLSALLERASRQGVSLAADHYTVSLYLYDDCKGGTTPLRKDECALHPPEAKPGQLFTLYALSSGHYHHGS